MIEALRALAERIDRDWQVAGSKPTDLPAIASRLLAELRPDKQYDLGDLANWTLSQPEFPDACNPFGPLGPPAFTVWSNGRFFVNVYAYTTPEVVVHDHDFAGAFMNLSGVTIHCTYEFADADPIDPTVHVGALRLRNIEAIGDGSIRQIEPGRGFIHQVWHISQPTVVLVIRTPALSPEPRQYQYLRPSIATQVFRSESLSRGYPDRFRNTRKMAEALRTSPTAGVEYIRRLVQREQPWDAVWHVMENWRYLRGTGTLEDVLAHGAKHQGEWFSSLEAAGMELDAFQSVNWQRVSVARDRIVLALLASFRSWTPIRKTLETLIPGADAAQQIAETLGRLSEDRTISLDLKAEGRDVLTSLLRGEASASPALQTLREQPLLRPLFA